MDVFSTGCVIYEILMNGQNLCNLKEIHDINDSWNDGLLKNKLDAIKDKDLVSWLF